MNEKVEKKKTGPPVPPGWNESASPNPKHRAFFRELPTGRTLIALFGVEDRGGRAWAHLSVSVRAGRRNVLPSWDEFVTAKEDVLGRDVTAVQVLPSRDAWYSIGEVLHLFAPIDGAPVVPDLRDERGRL